VHAYNSNLPIFNSLNQDESTMARGCTLELIMTYIDIYYPGTNAQAVAIEFVSLIFHERKDWTIIDVQAFINHIKKTQYRPQTIGHKISPMELIDCIPSYENLKIEHCESMYHNFKIKEKQLAYDGEVSDGFKNMVQFFEKKAQKKYQDRVNERIKFYENRKLNTNDNQL